VILVGPGMEAFGTRAVPDPDLASGMITVFVDNLDAHWVRAKAAGVLLRERPRSGGDRQCTASNPGGHRWTFAEPRESP